MSFITKRERVFNEYDLFDLPARNEGKLKAYASCTDARAWSHFCSDKSEHLVEIIKRNNQTVRPKYIPTDVIVNTLMSGKNAEIARLKRKIEEFEQMISAYDQLDLTSEQKGDIANAHAAIKAANKELDDMCLDLDLSGFTEGIDSEAFETGKSRGDEPIRYNLVETERSDRDDIKTQGEEWSFEKEKKSTPRKESKSIQAGPPCTCDVSTSAHDTQLDEMQETIISKDAKLSAMQNTLAVMEHDVCEPYCIYAHIYTALEKIFGTLCQNGKYKQYLYLLTAGKDTRGIDIKGKILFKMKVLEKFSLALIAPCSQEFSRASKDCSCYRAEVVTTFALTSAESQKPSLDNKRAQLVADIMDNQEMKEILSKERLCLKVEDEQFDECFALDSCSADVENLNRLKNLQANYDELLTCYDNLKHERDCLFIRCQKYADLELECESLKNNLREYNELWKEKEYYRKRSEDLDTLKENYFILSEETSNIETKLKSEQEINNKKSQMIDQLRKENIKLEQNIADTSVLFEKQKNNLICKLKECECKIMCQDQQIKSLSEQIDKLLEQDKNNLPSHEDALRSVELIDEIEFQKEQIKNLKEDLCCSEEEKQYLQEEFEKKLELINELKLDVEDWKSKYGEVLKNCNYLQMQVDELQDRNSLMNQELENKTSALDNLNHIICSKSREISNLLEEVDHKKDENMNLVKEMKNSRENFDQSLASLLNEKTVALNSIISARQESVNVLKHLKNTEDPVDQSTLNKFETQGYDKNTDNNILVKEIELLHDTNLENISLLQNENNQLKKSFDLAKNESLILEQRLLNQDNLLERFEKLKQSHEDLLNENETLQLELNRSKLELDNLLHDFQLTKKESESLLDESEDIKEKYAKLQNIYQKVLHERNILQKIKLDKDLEINDLIQSLNSSKLEQNSFLSKLQEIPKLEKTLMESQNKYEQLLSEKNALQSDLDIKTAEINNLYKDLETKIEENQQLQDQIKRTQSQELAAIESISALKNDNYNTHLDLDAVRKENALLLDKMKHYINIENQYKELEESHKQLKFSHENLVRELNELKKNQQENREYSDKLEMALINSREENISKIGSINDFYADLKIEVNKLKEEKLKNHREMKSLIEKLDKMEFIITNLNEDILARDRRISTLENHINELQVEITALQHNLKDVVESGEELKQLSFEKLDQSFKKIEAHQSKATHNMKVELAKLRNDNEDLQNKLSLTKLNTEEIDKEKNKYTAVINKLQNERELIIKDIKQLEISSVGDSNLLPNNCSLNEVLTSLERIGKYIINKNNSLGQTLRNVQLSSQLLKTKADEAKNIAEKEQQKIMNDKEQIKKERIEVEKQLEDMKNKIREERANYEKFIRDLESENLNQQLIFDKIKQSKEDHILNLIDENQRLRDQCNSYDIEIKEIKEKLQFASKQISKKTDLIEDANRTLEYKDTLVTELQKQIDHLKHTPTTQEVSVQTILFTAVKDDVCQTDVYYQENSAEISVNAIHSEDANIVTRNSDKLSTSIDVFSGEDRQRKHQISNKYPTNLPVNEVQILTANFEPKIDLARNIYLEYKLKRLSPGKLEQHSIASLDDTNERTPSDEILIENQTDPKSAPPNKINHPLNHNNESIIDIYNTQFSANSTKISGDIYTDTSNKECTSPMSDLENKTAHFENENTSSGLKTLEIEVNLKASLQSTEKDLFVIYKESDSIYEEQSPPQKIKDMTSKLRKRQKKFSQSKVEENLYSDDNAVEDRDDDSIKPKLEINLPRVINDSPSLATNSDDDKKSLDSGALPPWEEQSHTYEDSKSLGLNLFSIPSSSKNQIKEIFPENTTVKQYFDKLAKKSIIQSDTTTDYPAKNVVNVARKSNHKLDRVGARILVLQNSKNDNFNVPSEDYNVKSNYGLQYILNSVQNEINPNNFNLNLRKTYSVERINMSESSQSNNLNALKLSSIEHGTVSTYSPLPEAKVDRGTLVKLDDKDDYENKIKEMSNALKNIERHYKKKIEAIKIQYDSNVKSIINEHNHGVRSIQNLHEETLQDIKNIHENEVENLRTMSFEALRELEKLQIENRCLKSKFNNDASMNLHEEPTKIPSPDSKRRKCRCRVSSRTLTKTNVEAFNVRPRRRSHGPCTCSLDMSISGSIRNIFEQVDVEQRNMGERAYLKYIVNKILDGNVEALDAQELSFLHLKVCRTWKTKLNIEEAKQIKIDSLEAEWNNKQRQNQRHIAELDRQVAEERRRLQEVREALCFSTMESRDGSPELPARLVGEAEKDVTCCTTAVKERRSAGDLTSGPTSVIATPWKRKRGKLETSKAVLAKMDVCEGRRDKALVIDETPTRMKRVHDRHNTRTHKK